MTVFLALIILTVSRLTDRFIFFYPKSVGLIPIVCRMQWGISYTQVRVYAYLVIIDNCIQPISRFDEQDRIYAVISKPAVYNNQSGQDILMLNKCDVDYTNRFKKRNPNYVC